MLIIYSVCLAYVWVNILQVPHWFKGFMNFKPINCEVCLSGWFCMVMCFADNYCWIDIIGFASIAMIGQILLIWVTNKL